MKSTNYFCETILMCAAIPLEGIEMYYAFEKIAANVKEKIVTCTMDELVACKTYTAVIHLADEDDNITFSE